MPGLVKIGKTTTAPSQRMQELHSTGVPTPFELEFAVEVADCHASERAAHGALNQHRVSVNREFFEVSARQAILAILPVLGEYQLVAAKDLQKIEEIETQLRRQREEIEAKLRRQREEQEKARGTEERERARAKVQRSAELQRQLTNARAKLSGLGPRPVKRDNGLSTFLILCWMPLPWGFFVWLGALQMFGRPGSPASDVGVVCLTLLIFGALANNAQKKRDSEFSKTVAPFLPVEAEIHELETTIRSKGGEVPAPPLSKERQLPLARGEDVITILSVAFDLAVEGGSARVFLPTGRVLEVQIPRGVQERARLRLRGQGYPSPNGGEPGDAVVMVKIEPSDDTRRQG